MLKDPLIRVFFFVFYGFFLKLTTLAELLNQNNEKINGAKTWMLVYSDGNASEKLRNNPVLYRAATDKMVQKLFPKEKLEAMEDGDLSYTCPPNDEIYAGCFEGGAVGVPLSQQRSLEVTIRQNLTVAS